MTSRPGVAGQELDHLPFGGGQANLPAVATDALGGEVDAEIGGLDHGGVFEDAPAPAARPGVAP